MSVDVDELYRTFGPMVLRRCRKMLRNEQEAVEAMQETFVRVLRNQDRLEKTAPRALLYTIATNACLNRIRTRHRRPEDPDDALIQTIASAPETDNRAWARVTLDRIFGREPASTRVIATLFLLDGMTWEEVAAEVGMSVSGVRKRVRTLKAHVAALEGVE